MFLILQKIISVKYGQILPLSQENPLCTQWNTNIYMKIRPLHPISLIVIPLYAEIFDCNLNTANQMDENRPL